MFKKKPPLLVIVDDSNYYMYGPPTPRSIFLAEVLRGQGGISDTVAPGSYDFNVKRHGLKMKITLLPHKEN